MKSKKANISFYLYFLFIIMIIVIITAVVAPMGARFGVEFYKAGANILNQSHDSIADIDNVEIRTAIQENLELAQENQELNIQVNSDIYRYGWILLIGIAAIGIFLWSRRTNEVRGMT